MFFCVCCQRFLPQASVFQLPLRKPRSQPRLQLTVLVFPHLFLRKQQRLREIIIILLLQLYAYLPPVLGQAKFSKSTRWSLSFWLFGTQIPPMLRWCGPLESICHCWPGCMMCLHWCVSLLVRVGAPLASELMRLVRVRPRLRAVPLLATANLAADLHLLASLAAVSPAVADVLASLGTTLGRTIVSAFVFVCAPPTYWAIGGRHCS